MVETGIPYLASQCSSISTKRPRRNAQWWADKEDWIIFDVLDWVASGPALLMPRFVVATQTRPEAVDIEGYS